MYPIYISLGDGLDIILVSF